MCSMQISSWFSVVGELSFCLSVCALKCAFPPTNYEYSWFLAWKTAFLLNDVVPLGSIGHQWWQQQWDDVERHTGWVLWTDSFRGRWNVWSFVQTAVLLLLFRKYLYCSLHFHKHTRLSLDSQGDHRPGLVTIGCNRNQLGQRTWLSNVALSL